MARTVERDELMQLADRDPWLALVVAMIETARREAEAGSPSARQWVQTLRADIKGRPVWRDETLQAA